MIHFFSPLIDQFAAQEKSSNSRPREDSKFMEKREPIAFSPWPPPIHKLSMMFMVWNVSIVQLGYLSG